MITLEESDSSKVIRVALTSWKRTHSVPNHVSSPILTSYFNWSTFADTAIKYVDMHVCNDNATLERGCSICT